MKSPEHITNNGKAVFYASIWPDLKTQAINCGWALGLHGSLNSDMDIMAMPWTEQAVPVEKMIDNLCELFADNAQLKNSIQITKDKPNNRVVYTISIWADYYLDINVIQDKFDKS